MGLCRRVTEVRIVHALLFPYTPWAGILRKVPFPSTTFFICYLFFFFFFLFFQAAKLNYVRFEESCVVLFPFFLLD
jgi:uncharacterized RDD family membrane protein YckC